MKDRDKLIRFFEASGSGEEARRMIDLAEQVLRGRPYRVTEFTSPAGLTIADAIKANYPSLTVKVYGGYERAERIRIAFVESQYDGPIDYEISALKVSWDPRFRLLTHRDVLGSLMGLGFDREKLGDILMVSGGAQVIATSPMASYIKDNFTKIAMVAVSVEDMDLSDIEPKEERVKDIKTTVPSMRLDAVASSGFSLSRTKLVEAINAGLVQVNWKPAKGPAQEVKEGDVISFRGRGRMVIESITGMSRKGRTGVHLKRFM